MRKLFLAGMAFMALSGSAFADTVTYTSSGSFSNVANCSGCSVTGGGTQLNMSGINQSYIVANPGSGNYVVGPNVNDAVLGSLTWTNNASLLTDPNFQARYTLSVGFTSPVGVTGTQAFALDISQFGNPLGYLTLGFNGSLAGIANINLGADVALTDVHWIEVGGGSFDGTHWYNPENTVSKLELVGDFINTNPNVGAVPEASTWAMMILGFFGVGGLAMAKRRREGGHAFRVA